MIAVVCDGCAPPIVVTGAKRRRIKRQAPRTLLRTAKVLKFLQRGALTGTVYTVRDIHSAMNLDQSYMTTRGIVLALVADGSVDEYRSASGRRYMYGVTL